MKGGGRGLGVGGRGGGGRGVRLRGEGVATLADLVQVNGHLNVRNSAESQRGPHGSRKLRLPRDLFQPQFPQKGRW